MHTLHINLYDLTFFGVVFTGLNFALLLAFTKRVDRSANKFLAMALVVMVVWMARVSAIDIRPPLQFSLALGPLIYFYVLKLTRPEYKFSQKDVLHFIPVLLEQIILQSPVLPFLAIISIVAYLYCSHQQIERFYLRLKFNGGDRYRYELRWLHRFLKGFGLLLLLWIPYFAIGYFYYHHQLDEQAYYPFYLCVAVILIWIAIAAYLKPNVGAPINLPAFAKPLPPAELKQKVAWLKNAVKTNRYYLDPELSLNSLAEKLGLTTHELSRILNTVLKKSFNDFINEFRVTDVIRKMQDTDYDHITLLGIALDSGFNSQSTFTRIFKNMTGKSPLEYKNELKKDCPPYNLGSNPRFATIISFHETTPKWSSDKLNRNYMFKNYLKIAFRNFWHHKLFTLINILGLSIGISAALVIYLIVHFDLTFDKFHKDSDRIYRVVTNFSFSGQQASNPGVCGPLPWAIKNQVTGLQQTAPIFRLFQPNVTIPDGNKTSPLFKLQDNVIVADGDYFKLFEYKWLAGSAKSALSAPNQVVLTSEQAEKYFPGLSYEQMLGRIVVYDTLKTAVSGIVQTIKQNTDFTFHDFISFPTAFSNPSLKAQLRLNNWGGVSPEYQVFVKLAPQITTARIERQVNDIMKKNNKMRPGVTEAFALQPLADIHFNTNYGTFGTGRVADKTTLYELFGIALFLLLLGCINFINLTTAQSTQRAKEIGIRKTMGSSRKQLIFQFLSETFFITLLAVIISVGMTPVILKFFSDFIPAGVKADLINQPGIILFLAILSIIVSLLSGFYPALVLSGYKTVAVLKNQVQTNSGKTRNAWLRKSLTVTQFAIAQFFMMATILVSKQIYYALHKDLGFKKDAIIIINSPWKNRDVSRNQVFMNKLNALPQVEMVSAGRDAPTSDDSHSTEAAYKDGKKEIKMEDLGLKFGDENYIKVYHIKLLAGRNLQPGDTSKAFLINSKLAKMMGFKDPHDAVGKQIDNFNGDKTMQIIGVVADFNPESMHAAIKPLAILTSTNSYFNGTFHIALKAQGQNGGDWKAAIAGMEKAWKEVYPEDDFEYNFFDETIARLYTTEQRTSALLSWATGLSILISCLGLLGLTIYTTNQRTKEIGVRKVLGATVAQITALLSKELVGVIVLGFVIVSPIAWWAMNKWIANFADHTPISWWVFALSGGVMFFAALFTSCFQTIKAAIANPVKSLRSE